ncbi:MAG: DoxX family protein [Nitrospirota bacterium]
MWKKLLYTNDDTAALVLRIALGAVMLPHGMQKLLGSFGGHGFEGTIGFFTAKLGIPALFAFLAIAAESFGALGLIAGLGTRIAALGVTVTIGVAALMLHAQHGFFMNWFGQQQGEGIEYHLLVVAMGIALMITGGGKWSVDRAIAGSRSD